MDVLVVAGLFLGLAGCVTTSSNRQTITPIVRAIIPREGGIEVVRCAITHVYEEKQDVCLDAFLSVLTMSNNGSWSHSNDFLEDPNCTSTFISLEDAS